MILFILILGLIGCAFIYTLTSTINEGNNSNKIDVPEWDDNKQHTENI
jgi:hypothetical protein